MKKEYVDFIAEKEIVIPSHLNEQVTSDLNGRLLSDKRNLIIKVILMHSFAGLITLLICPQLGWNPFNVSPHLSHQFMDYGVWACGLFCGALFMGAGSFSSLIFIRGNDFNLYSHNSMSKYLFISAFFVFSLMVLSKFESSGADELRSVEFVMSWVLASIFINELIIRMRKVV